MREFKRDDEFNKIGRCWLLWNTNNSKFYEEVRKLYDEDLYLMYDHLAYVKDRLDRLYKAILSGDDMKRQFEVFARELAREISNMIYSKEIQEKYDK